MKNKLNMYIDPFEGDYGDGEVEIVRRQQSVPTCHECGKRLDKGKVIVKVDCKPDWDEEKINEVQIFYWHKECWIKMDKEQQGIYE